MPISTIEVFDRYSAMVYRRCLQILHDEEQAKDAVQEVFLRIMTRAETYRGESAPMTWIYRIATTYCLQQIRNFHRRQSKLQQFRPPEAPHHTVSPENRLTLMELFFRLNEEEQLKSRPNAMPCSSVLTPGLMLKKNSNLLKVMCVNLRRPSSKPTRLLLEI